jgi:hypothetical protein
VNPSRKTQIHSWRGGGGLYASLELADVHATFFLEILFDHYKGSDE